MIATQNLHDLFGKTVVSSNGNKIGKVHEVYQAADGSEGTFVTVSTGLFGSGASFVPLNEASLQGDDIVVPYDKDLVKDAPRIDEDKELSEQEEERLYSHYSLSGVGTNGTTTTATTNSTGTGRSGPDEGTQRGAGQDTSGPNTDDAMTRSEQRLEVGTATKETGRARLRKYIVTENETRTVPVSHEEVRIEREPINDGNVSDAMRGGELTEEEHEVTLHAERPVVGKETVPVERVRLGTDTFTEEATVSEDVSHEVIELDDKADANRTNR